MNPPNPPRLASDIRRFLRPRDVLAALPDLGPLYAQARGVGGGLGRKVRSFQPLFIDGLDFAFDPDHGLGFAVKKIVAIHVTLSPDDRFFRGTLEFEFADFPRGLGLHLLPEAGDAPPPALRALIESSPTEKVADAELASFRDHCRRPMPMCPVCQDRARNRSDHPERHPIHTILNSAREHGITLDFRLPTPHVDLATRFTPACIEIQSGFLIASDGPAEHALHIDMRRLHAIAIDTARLDGSDYTNVRLFDSYGSETLQILAENVSLAGAWRSLCEDCDP
jgi:hypothetical protein